MVYFATDPVIYYSIYLLPFTERVGVILEADLRHEPAVSLDGVLDVHESAVREQHSVPSHHLALRVPGLVSAEVEELLLVFYVVFVLVLGNKDWMFENVSNVLKNTK